MIPNDFPNTVVSPIRKILIRVIVFIRNMMAIAAAIRWVIGYCTAAAAAVVVDATIATVPDMATLTVVAVVDAVAADGDRLIAWREEWEGGGQSCESRCEEERNLEVHGG